MGGRVSDLDVSRVRLYEVYRHTMVVERCFDRERGVQGPSFGLMVASERRGEGAKGSTARVNGIKFLNLDLLYRSFSAIYGKSLWRVCHSHPYHALALLLILLYLMHEILVS